jgi:hypothetical protein
MDVDNKLDMYIFEIFKKVIRKGKLQKKVICPVSTMKAKDGKCVPMLPKERKNRLKATKKTGKLLKANLGVQKRANRKRAKSLRKRAMRIPDVGAVSIKFTGTGGE